MTEKIKINIPSYVNKIIHRLESFGYEAYIVGGCVRDSIIGREPHDWDVCTSATPEQMKIVFKDFRVIETGIQHGTLTVLEYGHNESVEVTTYRIDGNYSDGRHPDSVEFTDKLEEDLSRRDFTVNAIAYNDEKGLYDPFNGLEDIRRKIIRCVNHPRDRFSEDALRIIRAARFRLQLGFIIEPVTEQFMGILLDKIDNLSKERITSEMYKMIVCPSFWTIMDKYPELIEKIYPIFKDMRGFDQNNPYHIYDLYDHTMYALRYVRSTDPIIKFALLFHDIGKMEVRRFDEEGISHYPGHGKESKNLAKEILIENRFDNISINQICELVLFHDMTIEDNEKSVKKLLNKLNTNNDKETAYLQFERLLTIREADTMAHKLDYALDKLEKIFRLKQLLIKVKDSEATFSLKDLQVNGNDIMGLGVSIFGPIIGLTLTHLLDMVIDEKIENTHDELINEAKKFIQEQIDMYS